MRTISTDLENILSKQTRRVDVRVQIEDGDGVLQDLTDFKGSNWVIAVDCGEDIDAECMDAIIRLARDIEYDSMAPLSKLSRTNLNAGGTWDPILFIGREVVIECRYAAGESVEALDWIELFRGAIDIINWGPYEVEVSCRDQMRTLMDTFIETEVEYSDITGESVQSIMQLILDDNLASPPTLYVPTDPLWQVTEFWSDKQSIMDQLNMLVDMIGWRCKYKWDNGTSTFRLTLIQPDRTKVAVDRTFADDDYYNIPRIDTDIKNIRNAVTVWYPDPADLLDDGTPTFKFVTVENPSSIAEYDRRWMSITEAATSIIDSSAEAERMAEAILSDLDTPKVGKSVEMPLFAPVELDDLYAFTANNIHYTDTITMAVVGYRHSFTDTAARTVLTLREGVPAGRNLSWFGLAAGNGMGTRNTERTTEITNGTLTAGDVIPNGLQVSWETDPTTLMGPGGLVPGKKDIIWEVHITEPGGTPTDLTLMAMVKGNSAHISVTDDGRFPVDTAMDVHVRSMGSTGYGTFATLSNVMAKTLGSAGMNPKGRTTGTEFSFNEFSRGPDYPPDGWDMDTGVGAGVWGTDVIADDGTEFGVDSQFGTYMLMFQ